MPTTSEVKNWYNQRYSSRGRESMRPLEAYSVFLDHLDVQSGQTLLDISCGVGFLLRQAYDRQLKPFGLDLSTEAVQQAHRIIPLCPVLVGRGEDLVFRDGVFDYVTCIGSLEHFLDMERGLSEMRRVAAPLARFCIVVPNSQYLFWKFRRQPGTEQQDINETLLTLNQWRRLFTSHRFAVLQTYQDRWLANSLRIFSSFNPLKIGAKLLYKLLWLFLPLTYTYQFIFILQKSDKKS